MGTYTVSDGQAAILLNPGDPEDAQVKFDGTVYFPWPCYARRLTAAFGPLGWGLQPLEKPSVQDNTVYVHYLLIVRGCPVADAVQGHPYYASNRNMDYADAVESAKSECLRRCCKQIGMLLEPWDAAWRAEWKMEHAVQVRVRGKSDYQWRRRDGAPLKDEIVEGKSPESEYAKRRDYEEDARDHIDDLSSHKALR